MYTHRYNMHWNGLEHVFELKDLGVTIEAELKFEENISAKARKAKYNGGSSSPKFLVSRLSTFQKAVRNVCVAAFRVRTGFLGATSYKIHQYDRKYANSRYKAHRWSCGLKYTERPTKLDLPTLPYRRA